MTTPKKDGLQVLRSLRHDLLERLRANPDYVTLKEVEKAIERVESVVGKTRKPRTRGKGKTKITQTDAAKKVLITNGEPLPIGNLLDKTKEAGAHVGGADPRINLASALSKDNQFRSVIWNGKPSWWLVDQDYPGEHNEQPDIQEDEMNETEAASNESSASLKRYSILG